MICFYFETNLRGKSRIHFRHSRAIIEFATFSICDIFAANSPIISLNGNLPLYNIDWKKITDEENFVHFVDFYSAFFQKKKTSDAVPPIMYCFKTSTIIQYSSPLLCQFIVVMSPTSYKLVNDSSEFRFYLQGVKATLRL